MSAVTATSWIPSSFQLKLALDGRKLPPVLVQTRLQKLDRRCYVLVRDGVVKVNGAERRPCSWVKSNSSSADNFSGWSNADSGEEQTGDSHSKQSLAGGTDGNSPTGILGAGVAGIILVTGLTFAALSLSKQNTSRVKQQMEPLMAQQEKSLSSDDQTDGVEERNEKTDVQDSISRESNIGVGADPSSYGGNIETKGNRSSDDADMRHSFVDGKVTTTVSTQLDTENKSAINAVSVAEQINHKPPESDTKDDLFVSSSFQDKDVSVAQEAKELEGKENPDDARFAEPSLIDANTESLTNDWQGGVSRLGERENLDFPPNSSVKPSNIDISIKSKSNEVVETGIINEGNTESGELPATLDVESTKMLEVSLNQVDVALQLQNLNSTASSGTSLVTEAANQLAREQQYNDYNDISADRASFVSTDPGNFFTSAGIPAPSVVSAALQAPPGKVLVPAPVDQLQGQALSALQALKVMETDVQPGDLCTRREYVRWLVAASSAISRSAASKVYPAMFIENVSELAFDDIKPEDPDFPSIQGLAEAGLIHSKLSRRDMQSSPDEDTSPLFFSPESPLSRQDLVSWKMALEKRQLPVVDRKTLEQLTGFIDTDKIDPDAWPSLVADLAAGEQGIITLAFGYTRLFQPDKPVTKAQAAIALATGDASATVSEELARIEAESMAEKAVAAHSALVDQVEKDLNATYEQQLNLEREKISVVEKLAEEAKIELERLRAERGQENLALMKERAAIDSEMEVLSRLRRDVEEQLQILMSDKLEISYEKEKISKLRKDTEVETQEITRLQHELEVERKALSMARSWAEDEAKRAREQAKALEEARDRWERQGIKVVVGDDLNEEADAAVTWLTVAKESSPESTIARSENLVDKLRAMANEVKGKSKDTINAIIQKILSLISVLKEKVSKLGMQARELKETTKSRLDGSLQGLQQSSRDFTSNIKEGVKRVAGDCREGVERLSQKFKT